MRAAAQKRLNDLRWLREADAYLASARAELCRSPDGAELKAFVRLTEEVVAYERQRLCLAAGISPLMRLPLYSAET